MKIQRALTFVSTSVRGVAKLGTHTAGGRRIGSRAVKSAYQVVITEPIKRPGLVDGRRSLLRA